jgi:hypothetical protein
MRGNRASVRLGRSRRLTLYIVGMGVWLSGGLWLLFHYFFIEQGEFGPKANPFENWWLKLHGAFAFAAIWVFGLLWGAHVTVAWPLSLRRWSGGVTTAVLFWLTLSGYLLYYEGAETARSITSVLHWSIGLACPMAFFWHRFKIRRRRPKSPNPRVGSVSEPGPEATTTGDNSFQSSLKRFNGAAERAGKFPRAGGTVPARK